LVIFLICNSHAKAVGKITRRILLVLVGGVEKEKNRP